MSKMTNRLIHEKSPYLLQHAHNPVDWYPWGEEAFKKAKTEDKPIFLSVGYSTCHWCHVMEHESFEKEDVAEVMNKYYINIKVDREENPGIDKLYMTFVQLTTGGGGWPMSVFLTPDLHPFFGATYLPPEDKYGRPGFKTLLNRIAQLWQADSEKIKLSGEDMTKQLKSYVQAMPSSSATDVEPDTVAADTFDHFRQTFDGINGGFGSAPKFPTPVQLQFLFEYYAYNHRLSEKKEDAQKALDMALFTLRKIAAGGIHDHVGSGFHRYSTDKKWHVPHFEKMLYDQAQLLSLYSIAFQLTREKLYATVVKDIILYLSRDLRHGKGAFYCAEDADSFPTANDTRKKEGAFCVWEMSEIRYLLGEDDAEVFSTQFGCEENGNVDPRKDPHNELKHKNVLFQAKTSEETAKKTGLDVSRVNEILTSCKQKLWQYRATRRPKPHRDEKILTAWNGLTISGLVQAYEALQDPTILALAVETAEFIHNELYISSSQTLLRNYCNGPSNIDGFIDDYCFLIQALIDLYEATFEERWLEWASILQEKQDELFFDTEGGGYFNTSKDKAVLINMKEEQDGAEPSANSVSLRNLVRLSVLLNNRQYAKKAEATAKSFNHTLKKFPFTVPALVASFMLLSKGVKEIVLAGDIENHTLQLFRSTVFQYFLPNKLIAFVRPNGFLAKKNEIIQQIAAQESQTGQKVAAYICENFTCGLPISSKEELEQRLSP
ncbi:hypothetical protein BDF20DRAFT_870526 [Mycotypha africana]|uniref:uncharacterized protein n=1 Tax=Mycotypha africana TaxID=64632 RepID=UPI00230145D5|nr:uncharacterized protein BDF20DRAFT_870526 [Mycotypha africana]KAI8979591.1 hypothetical protein BDF20DRAFT_870526 [Mycotypha africana]